MADNGNDEFWLFGYGSELNMETPAPLRYIPPLTAPSAHGGIIVAEKGVTDKRVAGYITGYVRRFWQASEDHRGTPEAPGRVVTLIEREFWETLEDHHSSDTNKVWGTAYRIEASRVAEVREYLDIREVGGYTIHYTPFFPADGSKCIETLAYIGTPDNEQFMGRQEPQELAELIAASVGPSGLNRDYLLELEKALDDLSPESGDSHIKDLSDRVRAIEARHVNTDFEASRLGSKLKKVGSTDEQEEVEK